VVALWPLRDEKGQTLVDKLAGTLVVPKELAVGETGPGRPWYRTSWGLAAIIFLLLTYLTGYLITEIDIPKIILKWPFASKIIGRFFDPNWDILGKMLELMVETIYLALMATTLAIPVAGGLSFLGARNMMPRTWWGTGIYYVTRTFFNVFRSVEPIAWGIIFAAWVGIGPFAGTLALSVHSIAALGKLYSEQVESIDMGPVEAITSTGANKLQTIIYAVVPQVIPPFTAFTLYRWDINVRMSTIIGMVGGGGIGQMLIQYQQLLKWSSVGLIVWLITIVVWIMDISSGKIRERMV
jgi:phosphonate transport system permease protein